MLTVSTPAFAHEGEIPRRYTQEGENLSPELVFAGVPAAARSLVLIADGPIRPRQSASGCTGSSSTSTRTARALPRASARIRRPAAWPSTTAACAAGRARGRPSDGTAISSGSMPSIRP